ncbi:MAG: hypothetical protein MK105_17900 [Crocinitomicaceae bacterium]|nr:hypothetical protein [Crocinitomicaceae bacterium]
MNSAQEKRGLYFEQTGEYERTIRIKEFKKVNVQTTSGEEYFGRYSILSDSTIIVGDKTLLISEIATLSSKTKGIQFLRGTSIAVVSGVNVWGIFVLAYFGTLLPEYIVVLAADLILVAVLIGSKNGKKFEQKQWNIRVVE